MWQKVVRFSKSWQGCALFAVIFTFAAVVNLVGRGGGIGIFLAVVFLILAVSNALQAYQLYRRAAE